MADNLASSRSTMSTQQRRVARAAALRQRENMRNSIAGRIQRLYRKNPETARRMADRVMEEVRGTPRAQKLSENELRGILRDIKNRRKMQADTQQAASSASTASAAKAAGTPGISEFSAAGAGRAAGSASDAMDAEISGAAFAMGGGGSVSDRMWTTTARRQQAAINDLYRGKMQVLPVAKQQSPSKNDIWSNLSVETAKRAQVEANRQAKAAADKKKKFRAVLEEQEKLVRARKTAEANDVGSWEAEQKAELAKWKVDDLAKRDRVRRTAQEYNRLCSEQQQDNEARRAAEREQRRKEDMAMIQAAKDAEKREKMKQEQILQKNKRAQEQLLRDNKANAKILHDKMLERQAEEMKMAKDYAAMEEAKDRRRLEQLDKQAERIKRFMSMGQTAVAETDQREKDDARRALQWQQHYDREADRREAEKRRLVQQRKRDQMATLDAQIREKNERKKIVDQERAEQATIWEKERVEGDAREKRKADERRRRNMEQRAFLEKQILERVAKAKAPDQSVLEVQLNTKILQQVQKEVATDPMLSSSTSSASLALQAARNDLA
eukprot:g2976.t1